MKTTISEMLQAAGWTQTDARAIGSIEGRGAEVNVAPARKSIGRPIPLRQLLPPGAVVTVPGETETGTIEFSATSYYVRLQPSEAHDNPISLLRQLIEFGAMIETREECQ